MLIDIESRCSCTHVYNSRDIKRAITLFCSKSAITVTEAIDDLIASKKFKIQKLPKIHSSDRLANTV